MRVLLFIIICYHLYAGYLQLYPIPKTNHFCRVLSVAAVL